MKIIFLGAPGAGKGTQAAVIAARYSIPKLSTGDMLREAISSGSELGAQVEQIMSAGNLVSDEIMIKIIDDRIQRVDCERGFILDGFPRTIPQAEALEKILNCGEEKRVAVLFLDVEQEKLIQRLSGRYSCKKCGKSYHKTLNHTKVEGVCDDCGSTEFLYRSDDNEDAVRNRLKVYYQQTAPLISYYEQAGKLVKIDGSDSIESITNAIEQNLNKIFSNNDKIALASRG
jgi:adenylate kinase